MPTKPGVIRTCIGCRERSDSGQMLHFVREGQAVVPDHSRRLEGRGAWAHPQCLAAATERRAWGRALRIGGTPDLTLLGRG